MSSEMSCLELQIYMAFLQKRRLSNLIPSHFCEKDTKFSEPVVVCISATLI